MAPARARRKSRRREEDADVIILVSSDEEANVDLSARIVAKSRRREAEKRCPPRQDPILIHASPENSKKRKQKKRKSSSPVEPANFPVDQELSDSIVCGENVAENELPDNMVYKKLLRGPRYFEPGSARVDTCFNCFEEGHTFADCTAEKRQKPCFVCGMFGHSAYRCPQAQDCFICKERGHLAKDCLKKRNTDNPDIQICIRCGDVGHDMSSCRNEYPHEDLQKVQCYVCKGFGHFCCTKYDYMSVSSISCYVCGESGHSGLGCTWHWGDASNKAPKICNICGDKGHIARGCTQTSATSKKATTKKQSGRSPSSSKKKAASVKQSGRSLSSAEVSLIKATKICYHCHEKGHKAHCCPRRTVSSSAKHEGQRGEFLYSTPKSAENGRSGGCFGHPEKRKNYAGSMNRADIYENSKSRRNYENSRPRGGWIVADDPGDFHRRSWSEHQRSPYKSRANHSMLNF